MATHPRPARPSCNNCLHYYITHDAGFRYGCRALDFKSQRQPILDVIAASGQPCHYFNKKESGPTLV
jgi:hypothetical protein